MSRVAFAWRAAVLGGAFLAAVLGAPVAVLAPLGCLSLALTAELAARASGRDGVDRLLVAAGFALCAAVLGGVALGLLPGGLTRRGWAGYWLVLGAAVLAWRYRRRAGTPASAQPVLVQRRRAGWLVPGLATVLVLAAIGLAAAGALRPGTRPLALWLVARGSAGVTVGVGGDAGRYGPLRVVLAEQASGVTAWTSEPFRPAGTGTREVPVPVPGYGRWRIELVPAGGSAPVRELVVDGGG